MAVVEGDKESGPFTVGGLRYDAQTGARSEIAKVPVQDAGQLADAAKQIHAKLDEQWRGVAVVRRDAQDTLDVFVPTHEVSAFWQTRAKPYFAPLRAAKDSIMFPTSSGAIGPCSC